MRVHNLMEDLISKKVHEIFDLKAKMDPDFCTCFQCRLDVACYVLNRMKPQYIVSGRGLAHLESTLQKDSQLDIDVTSMINEGINKISGAKRPHFVHDGADASETPDGPLYNFPAIKGRVFNGITFEPLKTGSAVLTLQGNPLRMMDPNWQNPYPLSDKTPGQFSFWPFPLTESKTGTEKTFHLQVTIEKDGFSPATHQFDLKLTSAGEFVDTFHLEKTLTLPDLFLFPEEPETKIPGE